MARIELKNIQKKWGQKGSETWGVRALNLDIADQEFIVLLGPSGCGKTTTMRMISGLEEPSDGDILIDGENVNEVDPRDRDVAMVFQGYALYPNMTVYENIRFPLRMRNIPKDQHRTLVQQAAELVDISNYLDRKPAVLSGGQRQRAALARAIVRQPQIFLMDEPLSNLDAKLRQHMRVQIKHIQRRLKITTVYVTHDQVEAMTLADRVVIMDKGTIQQIGTPDEIYNDPANCFVAGFIGSPPMNLIEGMLENGVFKSDNVRVEGIESPPDIPRRVILGVRPEDCQVTDSKKACNLTGQVYGIEPTGDTTFLTVKCGDKMIEVKTDRTYRAELNSPAQISFDTKRLYLFDQATQVRLGPDPTYNYLYEACNAL